MRHILFVQMLVLCSSVGLAWVEFPVYPTGRAQTAPDVSDGIVVWQEYVNAGSVWDWDIYGIDLASPSTLISVAAYEADQMRPSIWGQWVAWEDNYYGDKDVWVSDISTPSTPLAYSLTPYENDQSCPAIHGKMVVWQHQIKDPQTQQLDWDIYMADITEPDTPPIYPAVSFAGNQQLPAVYRNTVVWQDDYYGDNDISSADVWLRKNPDVYTVSANTLNQTAPAVLENYVVWQEDFGGGDIDIYGADILDPDNPVEFEITPFLGTQSNPDISGNLVVWQDNRSGTWDIYGYNILTRQVFAIVTAASNQTNPAIDGNLVVFEDDRGSASTIYAVWLDGTPAAVCQTKVAGDITGDCRVNMADLAVFAGSWLQCGMVPASACGL